MGVKSNMNCALKVDTQDKGWYETTRKILKKIKGVSYTLDSREGNQGIIYISGKVDSHKILKEIAKHGNKVELCWMKTVDQYGGNNPAMDYSMPMTPYPSPYQRGFYPPPPPPHHQGPYYDQYHHFDPFYTHSSYHPYYY